MDNWINLDDIILWDANPNEGDVGAIYAMIERFGFRNPIGLNTDNVTKNGNHRIIALRQLKQAQWIPVSSPCLRVNNGTWEVQYVDNTDLSEDDSTAWGIADNRSSRLGRDDADKLLELLEPMPATDRAISGYDDSDIQELQAVLTPLNDVANTTLADRFIVPPFSILDARQGYWQERKRAWLALGIQSELGRGVDIVPNGTTRPPEHDGAYLSENTHRIKGKLPADSGGQPLPLDRDKKMSNNKSLAPTMHLGSRASENSNPTSIHNLPGYYNKRNRGWSDEKILEEYIANDGGVMVSGTSIFDPVLCELAYSWFTPVGAHILDPFAGGSVRGIVASKLGRQYTGIDLSETQIAANIEQGYAILADDTPNFIPVKISAKSARQPFNGCDPDYIANVCHSSCCQSSASPTGTMITIHPSEIDTIEARGGVIDNGLLQPKQGEKRCPFKTDEHLCGLHFTDDKPFGCIASPFTVNKNNTLIVRNRYRMLKCYNDGKKMPAYEAFRASLDLLFGDDEAERICEHLSNGGGDMIAQMPYANHKMLIENDNIKHNRDTIDGDIMPQWITGDSTEIDSLVPAEYDFIFTCPPYADLEIYSEDERDISNMPYPQFLETYRTIIKKSCAMLKDNRFAAIVVGDVRDKKGNYYNFVSDTIQAFLDSGLSLYNEAILVTSVGSLPIRVGKQFTAGRKLGKTHQNVLIFLKGNSKEAVAYCGDVDVFIPDGSD